jgi:hypothetical protein
LYSACVFPARGKATPIRKAGITINKKAKEKLANVLTLKVSIDIPLKNVSNCSMPEGR